MEEGMWEGSCTRAQNKERGGLAEKNQELGTKEQWGATDGFSTLEWHQI